MIKKYWKTLLITSLIILLPMVAGIIFWDRLPAQIPIHWNFAGEVDNYASKAVAVFALPLLMLAIQWVCTIATGADPKKKNHSEKMLQMMLWIIPLLSTVLNAVTYAVALGKEMRINLIVSLLLGLLFTVIGNYMPKCKQNYTIGIKLPWTLASEENWNKTHRFGGWVWSIGGLLVMLTGFMDGTYFFMIIMLVIALAPTVYSYILHLKKK